MKPQTTIRMSASYFDMVNSIKEKSHPTDFAAIDPKDRRDALASYARYVCELHGIKDRAARH